MNPAIRRQIEAALAQQRAADTTGPVNKYSAQKTACLYGHMHDSGREARDCNELHMRLRAGEISDLIVQHQFRFLIGDRPVLLRNGQTAGVKFDFTYHETATGQLVAQDSKGVRVRDWLPRRALFEVLFPEYEVRET